MLGPISPGAHPRAYGEPVATLPRSVVADPPEDPPSSADTWFRTGDGRRYAWEIAVVIVMKLALLLLLWFVFIKPWGHPATPVASTVQQIYLPDGPATRHD
jgi:hypothetical protein